MGRQAELARQQHGLLGRRIGQHGCRAAMIIDLADHRLAATITPPMGHLVIIEFPPIVAQLGDGVDLDVIGHARSDCVGPAMEHSTA